MNIAGRTKAYCDKCGSMHEAAYEREGNDIYFTVDCPDKPFRYLQTHNAELFLNIRKRSMIDYDEEFAYSGYHHINLMEITNQCNYSCNFCYTLTDGRGPVWNLSMDDIKIICKRLKKEKCWSVSITGGEPTMHPDIFRIIRLVKKIGLIPVLPTNGHIIGRNPDIAARLKKSGAAVVCLQFDTLDEKVQMIHRNNTFIEEKRNALKYLCDAGIKTNVITVATRHNVKELGSILKYMLDYVPNMYMYSIQIFFQDRNSKLADDMIVTREEVIESIVESNAVEELTYESFWPMPRFYPLKMDVHPDCGTAVIIVKDHERFYPVDKLIDVGLLYKRLAGYKKALPPLAGMIILLAETFRACRKGKRNILFKALTGLYRGKGEYSLILFPIENFIQTKYQDIQRTSRCGVATNTVDGISQDGCFAKRVDYKRK